MEKTLLNHLEQWEKRIVDKISDRILSKVDELKNVEIEYLKGEINYLQVVIATISEKKIFGVPIGMFIVHKALETIKNKDNSNESQKNNKD